MRLSTRWHLVLPVLALLSLLAAHSPAGAGLLSNSGFESGAIMPPGGLSAYAYWQMRAYQRTYGEQLVGPTRRVVEASFRLGR